MGLFESLSLLPEALPFLWFHSPREAAWIGRGPELPIGQQQLLWHQQFQWLRRERRGNYHRRGYFLQPFLQQIGFWKVSLDVSLCYSIALDASNHTFAARLPLPPWHEYRQDAENGFSRPSSMIWLCLLKPWRTWAVSSQNRAARASSRAGILWMWSPHAAAGTFQHVWCAHSHVRLGVKPHNCCLLEMES